jgi:hypothetical protein
MPLPDFIQSSPLHAVPVDAAALFTSTVPNCENWLGELSNMVLSAAGAACYPRPPTRALSYYGLLDIGTLLAAVIHQPLLYLRDHLGVFRQHAAQTTHAHQTHGIRVAFLVWAATGLQAWAEGRIGAEQALRAVATTVQRCAAIYGQADPVMNGFFDLVRQHGHALEDLHRVFTSFWLAFLASDVTTRAAAASLPARPKSVTNRDEAALAEVVV